MTMIIAIIITFISGIAAGFAVCKAMETCKDRTIEDHSIYMETIAINSDDESY